MFIHFSHQTQTTASRTNSVAVLPLGAMETHGPHLPLGTDGLIAEGLLDRATELDTTKTEILRLPLLWLGASCEHAGRAGTLSWEPEQLIAQIVSIAEGLSASGIQRLVLFNGHGGNIAAAAIAALKLRTRLNMLVASAHWLDFGLPPQLVPPMEDVHGGWIETSVLLHMAPHLVVKDAIRARAPSPPAASLFPKGPIAWGWKLDDLASNNDKVGGWIGHPDLATPALGHMLVNHAAQKLLDLLQEIAAAPWKPGQK